MALFLAENLVKAIETRDLLEVERSLLGGANPNLLLPNGVTPFHLAGGPLMDISIIQALLSNNANPDVTDSDGVTLSHIAAMWDKLDCLQLLYNSGADIFMKDKDGFDVLWYATDNNSTHCIDYVKGIKKQLEYVRKTPRTPTFDCNVSFRRKKTPKSFKSTPHTLKDGTTSPLAFNEIHYNSRQTPKHCSACKKSFSPQLCSDCHIKTPTCNNHVKNLCNELKNIDISNSTQKSKSVLGNGHVNLPDYNLSEMPDGMLQLKSPCEANKAKPKQSVNSSFVFYQNVFKQNEMLSETKENDSPFDNNDESLITFDKSVITETKPNLNTTKYDPEMQEFLRGCLPISHTSYNSAGGLDASSPDNCVTYAKSSSESCNSSSDSGPNSRTADNTSVWVTCCKPNGDLDTGTKATNDTTTDNNVENQTVENTVFENSIGSIVATPNSTQSSIEYRKKLLFSTKPKEYFEKLEKKCGNCEPIKIIPVHENENNSTSDSSSEFTLADSTVPVDCTGDDDDIDICKDILGTIEQGDQSYCRMVDNSVQFCNITKNLDAETSYQNAANNDENFPGAQNETNNTSPLNNDGGLLQDSYQVIVDNNAQISVGEGCLPIEEEFEKSNNEEDEVDKQLEWSKISENTVCDVLTDDEGIALLERRKFAIDSPIKKRLSKSIEIFSSSLQLSSNPIRVLISDKDESTLIYDDWKDLLKEEKKSSPNPTTKSQSDEDPIEKLSDKEIRQMLVRYGCHPGPIAAARAGYIKRLKSFLNHSKVPVVTNSSPPIIRANVPVIGRYSAELEKVLNGRRLPDSVADDDLLLRKQFEVDDPNVKWREGKLKNNFNYILLDPRKLNGLSDRISNLSELQSFQDFLSAIFYVGKGRQARPYAHFYEALQKTVTNQVKLNPKVKHIQEIWSCNLGVISLHIFQSVIACEAFTREAAMLDAIKLPNLTNRKRGDYYGKASTWSMEKKEQYGTFLLMKALKIYAVEGERQIKPANLKLKQQWPKNAHV